MANRQPTELMIARLVQSRADWRLPRMLRREDPCDPDMARDYTRAIGSGCSEIASGKA